ncbi:MAG: triose-phosphate isomerase [Sphingobacteriales bacterium]|nr:MAG: triose-phosphate isomerase [Sphingobacteriales bacterium]
MRKKIVAANWKMNLTLEEGKSLVEAITSANPAVSDMRQVVLATPYVHLVQTAAQLEEFDHFHLGAQNCYSESSGAFTGEISASMLQSAGVQYVIIGHSERREYFQENDAVLVKKMTQVLQNNMQVIFCCGEPLEVRDAARENEYVEKQIQAALFHLTEEQLANISIAYEPIWAIGTGRTASSQQAQDMHAHIRQVIANKYGETAASRMTILYGGSCNAQNAKELFACPDVDGGLIGGASLKSDAFLSIIDAMIHS